MTYHDGLREALPPIDLEQLEAQFSGSHYRHLVQEHLRKLSDADRQIAIEANIQTLTALEKKFAELLIDELNEFAHLKEFWRKDTGLVLRTIVDKLRAVLVAADQVPDDRIIFAIFQIATMNFASAASQSKEFRRHAGIRRSLFRR